MLLLFPGPMGVSQRLRVLALAMLQVQILWESMMPSSCQSRNAREGSYGLSVKSRASPWLSHPWKLPLTCE